MPPSRFSRVVPLPGSRRVKEAGGEWEVAVEGAGRLQVRIPGSGTSAAYVWTAGGLRFLKPPGP